MINVDKKGLFTIDERVELIKKTTQQFKNVEVVSFHGLLVDFVKEHNASVILKGLRAFSDFEYEFQMALMNTKLDPSTETLFMMTSSQYSYLSSSAVKQVSRFNGNLDGLVPKVVEEAIKKKMEG